MIFIFQCTDRGKRQNEAGENKAAVSAATKRHGRHSHGCWSPSPFCARATKKKMVEVTRVNMHGPCCALDTPGHAAHVAKNIKAHHAGAPNSFLLSWCSCALVGVRALAFFVFALKPYITGLKLFIYPTNLNLGMIRSEWHM
jgi:hypothetical protein